MAAPLADRDPTMMTEIALGDEPRKALTKYGQRFFSRCWKACPFPDLVETPGVAGVAGSDVFATDAEPAGDPDIDRVLLGQWP